MHRKTARMRVLVKRFLAEMQHRPASWQGIGVARLVDSETTRPPFVREIDERRRRVAAVWGAAQLDPNLDPTSGERRVLKHKRKSKYATENGPNPLNFH